MRILVSAGLRSAALLLVFVAPAFAQSGSSGQPTPLELFDQRIAPIFRSPNPSSCVQCHLSSVDLKNYILPSNEKTFASLRDQGLIDLDEPGKSKILTLIKMGEKDLDKGAKLIHEKTRQAEYDAFAAWITACCNDPVLRNLPKLSPEERARPDKPDEVIRHARKSRVVDSFARNVFSQRMRCFPCHTPHEVDENNPRQKAAVKGLRKLTEKLGEEKMKQLAFFQTTPEETLQVLIERSRNAPEGTLPLLNLDEPEKSLLLLKPLSKLPAKKENGEFEKPSSVVPVTHLGGLKMHPDDQSYKSFIAWIRDYANVVEGKYASVDELPADNWVATQKVLRLSNVPESWAEGTPVQLFVHAKRAEDGSWDPEPLAFTQGTVTPRRLVNGALFGLRSAAKWDPTALGGGEYLVKVYIDRQHRLSKDPTLLLSADDYAGQVVLKKSRWRDGFQQAPIVSAAKLETE